MVLVTVEEFEDYMRSIGKRAAPKVYASVLRSFERWLAEREDS
jgi:hypothetical protein